MRVRVRRAFVVAAAVVAAVAAMAPGAWAIGGLGITVSGGPDRLIVGDTATLLTTVTNLGTEPAIDLRANFNPRWDPFESDPPILSGPACTLFVAPALNCSLASSLGGGLSVQVPVTSSLPGLGPIEIQVGADADGDLTSPVVVWKSTVEPKADIKLDLSTSTDTIANGAAATIKALVTNTTSEATAYGAVVKFSIPPEVQVVSRPDDCTGTALSLTCPLGDLAPSLTTQRLLTLRSTQQGAFTVLATTTWARVDPTIIDTQGQTTVTVLAPPDPLGPGSETPAPTPTPAAPKPRAVSAGTLAVGLPASGRCLRTRRRNVVLRSIKNIDPVRATIRITGRKRAIVLKGSKARQPFVLLLPRRSGRITVSLAVTLENGRRYTAKRTYRLC